LYIQTSARAPSPRKRKFLRAGVVHRSEIAEPHAQERPTAWESPNPTRRSVPSLRNRQISRAGTFHRSEIAESHARERPTAWE